jgi:hypothetical protein
MRNKAFIDDTEFDCIGTMRATNSSFDVMKLDLDLIWSFRVSPQALRAASYEPVTYQSLGITMRIA